MKKIVYLLIAVLGVTSAFAQSTAPIAFSETSHNFGKIKQGVPASYVFTFKNTSDKPVVIESAVAGCGCTTPEYPKGAIAPGSSDKIKVTYNAANLNEFTKQVTVKVANVQEPIILTINGVVVDASAAATASATPATTPATTDKASTAATKTKMKATPSKTKVKAKS